MDLKERREIKNLSRHPWEISRSKVMADLLKEAVEGQRTVLDIGCGDLFLEEYLSGIFPGCHFFCVDIAYSDEEVTTLNRKYENVNVYNTLEAFAAEKVQIDVVLLLDVIEHIENDASFLENLAGQVFVGAHTRFIITVPAFQSLFTSHDVFLGHYRRYNLKKLKELLSKAGLEYRSCGYFYFALLLPRCMQKVLEAGGKTKRKTTGLVEWKGGRGITRFLSWFLTIDYRVGKFIGRMGIRLPGLSNYAICQKKHVL